MRGEALHGREEIVVGERCERFGGEHVCTYTLGFRASTLPQERRSCRRTPRESNPSPTAAHGRTWRKDDGIQGAIGDLRLKRRADSSRAILSLRAAQRTEPIGQGRRANRSGNTRRQFFRSFEYWLGDRE